MSFKHPQIGDNSCVEIRMYEINHYPPDCTVRKPSFLANVSHQSRKSPHQSSRLRAPLLSNTEHTFCDMFSQTHQFSSTLKLSTRRLDLYEPVTDQPTRPLFCRKLLPILRQFPPFFPSCPPGLPYCRHFFVARRRQQV